MAEAIAPRDFGGWYKIKMMRDLLISQQQQQQQQQQGKPSAGDRVLLPFDALVWIDADALVVQPHLQRFVDLMATHPSSDLIIGEDVTLNCLVSTGVMIVRECTAMLRA